MRGTSRNDYKSNVSLQRIAEALGGSVESLFEAPAAAHSLDEVGELLRLWGTLTKGANRAEALRAVRAIVAAQPN